MSDRDREIDQIRATYRRYRDGGRTHLWDTRNRGFARIVRDRDRALVDLIRRSLPPEADRVLDLGSGDGRLAEVVRDAGITAGQWAGADLDPQAIATAAAAMPWATWIEASADRLPFEDASFDLVIASTLFSSLPSDELEAAVAAEIGRILRPDGWLVWYDLRYDNPTNRSVHGISRTRMRRLFPGWSMEARTMTLAPPIARRLGLVTPMAYPLLELIPPLRSHLLARLKHPGQR